MTTTLDLLKEHYKQPLYRLTRPAAPGIAPTITYSPLFKQELSGPVRAQLRDFFGARFRQAKIDFLPADAKDDPLSVEARTEFGFTFALRDQGKVIELVREIQMQFFSAAPESPQLSQGALSALLRAGAGQQVLK